MTQLIVSTTIQAPPSHVWAVVSQLDSFVHYHPLLTKSELMSEQATGVGAKRVCETTNGMAFEEEVLEWQDGAYFVVSAEYTRGGAPIDDYRGTIRLTEHETGTLVKMITDYQPRGLMGRILDTVFMKRQFRNITQNIMRGLKHYVETGESATVEELQRIAG